MSELAQKLAEFQGKGYVIAPAGFGKTHLIALAVNASEERQLILTHTYAGVNALKNKMYELGVPSSKYQIDTIASFSLRLCLSYPKSSVWEVNLPKENQEWSELYERMTYLLSKGFVQRIIKASYSGFFVDEYQDCTITQHNLVLALSEILPCRIMGDPLQAIFDFAEPPVDWNFHVENNFECLGELSTPWRWQNANSLGLGEWLIKIRKNIESGIDIDLTQGLPKELIINPVNIEDYYTQGRYNYFYQFIGSNEKVIAIHSGDAIYKNTTHALAHDLKGIFSSIEEIEGTTLFSFINIISKAKKAETKLKRVIEFAEKCIRNAKSILPQSTKAGRKATITKSTKSPLAAEVANAYLDDPSSKNLMDFLLVIKNHSNTHLFRRDLFNRIIQILRLHSRSPHRTLKDVAESYQMEFRSNGRPIKYNNLIGTTLLVKGLEYDHAIILAPQTLSYKQLYVALTRGSKALTICTTEKRLKVNKEEISLTEMLNEEIPNLTIQ